MANDIKHETAAAGMEPFSDQLAPDQAKTPEHPADTEEKTKEAPPEPEPCPLSPEEMADLVQFAELVDRAPNPEAAQALIEEFYL